MPQRSLSLLVIGAGFSGVCLGIQAKRAGFQRLTILEKAATLGGTWRENTYPGAACDVPSFAYCYSFEQKTDWSRKWAPQPEILRYMEDCAERNGLAPHFRFGTEVESARWDEASTRWIVRTTGGEELAASVLVSAVGQLSRPYTPPLPGLDTFRGRAFHSAEWDHGVELRGKRVGIIGNAASAVQIVPEVAKVAEHLTVFQRSPNWLVPRKDRPYSRLAKWLFARVPLLARAYRALIWAEFEARFPLFRKNALAVRFATGMATRHLEAQVRDPELRRKLTPDYPVGAKRILSSDDYYPALQRPNVDLVTDGIQEIVPSGVVTRSGATIPLDVLVLATGFQSTEFLAPMRIEGQGGRSLNDAWAAGAEAYLGMTVPGFPNFFMMYGPNTNLGHNSILFMLECQTRHILECVTALDDRGLRTVSVRKDASDAYNARVQGELGETVWATIEHSWYKDATGRITNNWPGGTVRYWWTTRHAGLAPYEMT